MKTTQRHHAAAFISSPSLRLGSTTIRPPAPPHTQASVRPPPPPPFATTSFVRPPPPSPVGVASNCQSIIGGAPLVSPAWAKSVSQMTTPQLQQMARQLKMEVILSRFMGNPQAAERAAAKLNLVESQLTSRKAAEAEKKANADYAQSLKGQPSEQLESTRAREMLKLFGSQLRGDTAGIKSSQAKLAMLDAELKSRETALTEFGESLGGMNEEQLADMGTQLATELLKMLFTPNAPEASKENLFNRFGLLLAEQLGRGVVSNANDWMMA